MLRLCYKPLLGHGTFRQLRRSVFCNAQGRFRETLTSFFFYAYFADVYFSKSIDDFFYASSLDRICLVSIREVHTSQVP
jgi:hypothetical protein